MIRRVGIAVAAAFVAIALACETPSVLTPKTGPGTDRPCGNYEYSCTGATTGRISCCPDGWDCGDGTFGCAANECCDRRPFDASPRDGGAPAARRREQRIVTKETTP